MWLSEPEKRDHLDIIKKKRRATLRRQKQLHAERMQQNLKKECQRPPPMVELAILSQTSNVILNFIYGYLVWMQISEQEEMRLWTSIVRKITLFIFSSK